VSTPASSDNPWGIDPNGEYSRNQLCALLGVSLTTLKHRLDHPAAPIPYGPNSRVLRYRGRDVLLWWRLVMRLGPTPASARPASTASPRRGGRPRRHTAPGV
jgi:hypothetical protein